MADELLDSRVTVSAPERNKSPTSGNIGQKWGTPSHRFLESALLTTRRGWSAPINIYGCCETYASGGIAGGISVS